jgi:hypothetical protein
MTRRSWIFLLGWKRAKLLWQRKLETIEEVALEVACLGDKEEHKPLDSVSKWEERRLLSVSPGERKNEWVSWCNFCQRVWRENKRDKVLVSSLPLFPLSLSLERERQTLEERESRSRGFLSIRGQQPLNYFQCTSWTFVSLFMTISRTNSLTPSCKTPL